MNKYTGEVHLKIGEKDCVLVYDWGAIAAYQSKFGKDARITDFGIDELCDALLIGLKKHNPEITKEFIMDNSTPLGQVVDAIIEAFVYAHNGVEKGIEILEASTKVDELKKNLVTQ